MNGIEKIKARIEADAQAEIDRVLAAAKAEAAEITAGYQAKADAEAAELAGKNERAAAEREERLVSAAQMEARKVQLAAKQAMVEKTYAQALEKLSRTMCGIGDEKHGIAQISVVGEEECKNIFGCSCECDNALSLAAVYFSGCDERYMKTQLKDLRIPYFVKDQKLYADLRKPLGTFFVFELK